MKRILSPSLLSADFMNLRGQLDTLKECGITHLHYDVMDGVFVPNISFGTPVLKCVRDYTDLFLDAHLMIVKPEDKIDWFREAGADLISVHAEACANLSETLRRIRGFGLKAAAVINPETPAEVLYPYLTELDMILVMSVHPGHGGQKYIPECSDKIRALRRKADEVAPALSIQVDGGINPETIKIALDAGADNIVAGTAVFRGDIRKNVETLSKVLDAYQ